jgi:hypothetical protein
MRLSSFFTIFVFVSLFAVGTFGQSRKLNTDLRELVAGAANTLDAREMDTLLSEDFTQAEISNKESAVLTKMRILNQLSNVPEVFKPYNEHVTTRSEVANLTAVRNGETAVFAANLIARSTLKVSGKLPGQTVTQVERFDISGSAALIDGRWKLTSLRRSRTIAKDAAVRLAELNGNKAFDVAAFGLLLEGAARAKAASPPDFY